MAGRHITDAEYATALEEGRRAAETEFRAQAVSYLPERDAIEVITVRNGGFIIPRRLVGALQDASPSDLGTMEMWPAISANSRTYGRPCRFHRLRGRRWPDDGRS